mmetsp:Transcript_117808/g.328141  ORF Transcript_117808/g.328141 Transcript_117808/m.328141 type:complete len:358 (-) Transcript_117808:60-1133(-)
MTRVPASDLEVGADEDQHDACASEKLPPVIMGCPHLQVQAGLLRGTLQAIQEARARVHVRCEGLGPQALMATTWTFHVRHVPPSRLVEADDAGDSAVQLRRAAQTHDGDASARRIAARPGTRIWASSLVPPPLRLQLLALAGQCIPLPGQLLAYLAQPIRLLRRGPHEDLHNSAVAQLRTRTQRHLVATLNALPTSEELHARPWSSPVVESLQRLPPDVFQRAICRQHGLHRCARGGQQQRQPRLPALHSRPFGPSSDRPHPGCLLGEVHLQRRCQVLQESALCHLLGATQPGLVQEGLDNGLLGFGACAAKGAEEDRGQRVAELLCIQAAAAVGIPVSEPRKQLCPCGGAAEDWGH